METTLKEIGISIAKGVVYLVAKIIDTKITTRRIYIAFLIIFCGFIAICIIGIIFWGGPPPGSYEEWIQQPP